MKVRRRTELALILFVSFVFSACGGYGGDIGGYGDGQQTGGGDGQVQEEQQQEQMDGMQQEQDMQQGDMQNQQNVVEINMSALQFAFEPSEIRVKKGDLVRIRVKSTDVTHGFAINEYGINVSLEPNQEKVIEFTADKQGTFTFYCSVYCGAGHSNMRGTLVVE